MSKRVITLSRRLLTTTGNNTRFGQGEWDDEAESWREAPMATATMASAVYTPNLTSIEEAGLIRKVLSGERDLFVELITPRLAPLLHAVRVIVGIHSDFDDSVQQPPFKALTHLEPLRIEANSTIRLTRVSLNEARKWPRECAPTQFLMLELPTLTQIPATGENPRPLVEFQRSEVIVRLRAVLDWYRKNIGSSSLCRIWKTSASLKSFSD
jgi:hypothetical protein